MDTLDRVSLGLHRLGFLLAATFFLVGSVASFWIAYSIADASDIYAEFVRKLWSNYALYLSVTLSVSTGIYFLVRAIGPASWRLGEEAMAHRLGWVLYRICLGLAVFWIVVWVLRFFTNVGSFRCRFTFRFSCFRRFFSTESVEPSATFLPVISSANEGASWPHHKG